MGWFIRKSFGGDGPIRVNLSKSGIGFSFGVKGLRVGTGPRGQYVHAGGHGIYYRKQLGNERTGLFFPEPGQVRPGSAPVAVEEHWDQFHSTGDINRVVTPHTEELVQRVNGNMKKFPIWTLTGALFLVLAMLPWPDGSAVPGAMVLVGAVAAGIVYWQVDLPRRTTEVTYELDEWAQGRAKVLRDAVLGLSRSHVKRQVMHSRAELDWKRNAGAGQIIDPKSISIQEQAPRFIKTNISAPTIRCNDQILYFMPDYLYVFKNKRYGVLPYGDLNIELDTFNMIETSAHPKDAQLVGYTWEKVNRDGSPDRRFSHNRQIPKFRYAELDLKHPGGFRAHFNFSNVDLATHARDALVRLTSAPPEPVAPAPMVSVQPTRPVPKVPANPAGQASRRLKCPRCQAVVAVPIGRRPACHSCGFGVKKVQ